jgi:peroxiredoxin/outer membrane lipoprotein-sorting protein
MIYIRSTVAAVVVGTLACAGAAFGQVDENARQVLEKSAEAIKAVKDISATARHHATGPIVGGMVDTRGEFRLIKGASAKASASFYQGRAKSPNGSGDEVFHFYLNPDPAGTLVTWVDDTNKAVRTRTLTVRTEQYNQVTLGEQLIMAELFEPDPYAKKLQSPNIKIVLEGQEEAGGEKCDVVRASAKEGQAWTLWHIAQSDGLPRRREEGAKIDEKGEPVRLIIEWSDVKVNQNLTRKDLEIAVPEGYVLDEQKPAAPGQTAAATPPPPKPELGPGSGQEAPEFELKSAAGETVKLADLKGNVVVLAFGGTANGKWKDSLPVLEGLAQSFKGKPVKVFGAACREKSDEAPIALMKEKGYTFGLLLGADEVSKAYKVRGYPSFAVVDREGRMAEFVQGFQNEESLRERLTNAVREALGEASPSGVNGGE